MKISIFATLTLLVGISTAATAQTAKTAPIATTTAAYKTTPGYDRPVPIPSGHQHVVYWTSFFDDFDYDMQSAADAKSVDDIKMKPKAKKPSK